MHKYAVSIRNDFGISNTERESERESTQKAAWFPQKGTDMFCFITFPVKCYKIYSRIHFLCMIYN